MLYKFVIHFDISYLVLQAGLSQNFADVDVAVVDCPDLTQKPFMLAEKGENRAETD